MRSRSWLMLAMAAFGLAALLAVACGDDDDDDGGSGADLTAASVDCKGLGVTAPARIKTAGKLVVASDLTYAPMEFTKEGTDTAIGADVDIANCIAAAWGVKAEIKNTSFDAVIPSLKSKQVDVIMSSLSVTDERKKEVDFVEYMVAGSGILVVKGNPAGLKSLADLCGKDVAIQTGTVQIDEAKEQDAKCATKIKLSTFEGNNDVVQAVASKRAVAGLMDYPVAGYAAKKVKGTEVVGEQYNTGPYGIAVRKDDAELKTALAAAVEAMIAKGQYTAILKYWGLEAGKLK
ncbi:MAG: ABC transporter substrate-binding protein [Chloroflexi bacterium]|nr:ABC transporter substrate-binding protein [Chloroflexota bacterium]